MSIITIINKPVYNSIFVESGYRNGKINIDMDLYLNYT